MIGKPHTIDGLPIAIILPDAGSRQRRRALHQQLRDAIASGRLVGGAQLPPSRIMAVSLGIARNTVVAIYEMLVADGYVEARIGGGTFVCGGLRIASDTQAGSFNPDARLVANYRLAGPLRSDVPSLFNLRLGYSDRSLFPFDIWRQLTIRTLRTLEREAPVAAPAAGSLALREATAAHIGYSRAIACSADDCIITAGAQQAFDLVTRILVEPGKTVVAVENPGYPALHRLLAASGAVVVPVPVDEGGVRVDAIPPEAKVIFVTPSNHVPLGSTLSLGRRLELLDLAACTGMVIVEDDYEGEFRFANRPIDALKALDRMDSVFYVGTFTKCTLADLRLGYVVPPRWARQALLAAKQLADWHCPSISQETLALFLREGHLVRHTRRLRRVLGERRDRLLDALRREMPSGRIRDTGSGLHVALDAPEAVGSNRLQALARANGVDAEPLSDYYLPGTAEQEGLVLGIGLLSTAQIAAAAHALGRTYSAAAEPAPSATGS